MKFRPYSAKTYGGKTKFIISRILCFQALVILAETLIVQKLDRLIIESSQKVFTNLGKMLTKTDEALGGKKNQLGLSLEILILILSNLANSEVIN